MIKIEVLTVACLGAYVVYEHPAASTPVLVAVSILAALASASLRNHDDR